MVVIGEMAKSDVAEEIKDRVNILDIVSEYVNLKRSGRNYLGLCPFHTEKTPSFTVSEEKQIFHCFGCGAGGDVFSFVMRQENLSFPEALSLLAQRLGIRLDQGRGGGKGIDELYRINKEAMEFYHQCLLKSPKAERARRYLKDRGLTDKTISDFKIGYAPGDGSAITGYFRKKGIALDKAVGSGIVNKRGGLLADLFRDRIVFPIFDASNRVIGFGGRVLGDGMPKYLNTPETPIFKKRDALYGLNVSKNSICKEGAALIVEGYFDLISLYQHGVENVVATLGTALTTGHIQRLKRYVKKIFPLFDSDTAGVKAALRGMELFIGEDIDARVVLLPQGTDPDEFVSKKGKEGIERIIKEAIPIIDFYFRETYKGFNRDDPQELQGFVEGVGEILSRIENPVKRGIYVKRISEGYRIDESLISTAVNRSMKKGSKKAVALEDRHIMGEMPNEEDVILWFIIYHTDMVKELLGDGYIGSLLDMLSDPAVKAVVSTMKEKGANRGDGLQAIEDERLKSRLTRIDFIHDGCDEGLLKSTLKDCVMRLRLKSIKREKEELNRQIREAERDGRTDLLLKLLERKQEIARLKETPFNTQSKK